MKRTTKLIFSNIITKNLNKKLDNSLLTKSKILNANISNLIEKGQSLTTVRKSIVN